VETRGKKEVDEQVEKPRRPALLQLRGQTFLLTENADAGTRSRCLLLPRPHELPEVEFKETRLFAFPLCVVAEPTLLLRKR
jgi:hypothetical protein